MNDPFKLNDWKFTDFLVLVIIAQLLLLCSIIFDIPIFRQIIGFLYLSFLPGFVLLRVLKLHNLSRTLTSIFAVGLSLTLLMLLGFFLNLISPIFGFFKPLSLNSLVVVISIAVMILCAIAYITDRAFSSNGAFNFKELTLPAICLVLLSPILSILGTFFMNTIGENTILLILLFMISLFPILATFNVFPEKLYASVIFSIAISLLFHNSLISSHVTGWDIQSEYFYASLVIENSYWLSSIPSNINSMLSVVMLAPIYSKVCNLSLIWIFKIFYPILFSLVPVGLYEVWRKYISKKSAFLSCFLFMSVFTFYNEMPALARQQIAELFQVLLMLLLIEKNLNTASKTLLSVLFAFSMITSHYGLSYLFMLSLLLGWIILFLEKRSLNVKGILISNEFILFYCVTAFAWYSYISGSSIFQWILTIGNNILSNIMELGDPKSTALNIVTSKASSFLYEVTKALYMIVNFLILLGILALLLKCAEGKFDKKKEYAIFSLSNFAFLLSGMLIPYFSNAIGTTRLYHISLLFLAPFSVVGGSFLWNRLQKKSKSFHTEKANFLKVLSLFLMVFLLFSSGFIYEIAHDRPSSISLNGKMDFPRFNCQEVAAAEWLKNEANMGIPAYSDLYRKPLLDGTLGYAYYLRYPQITVLPHNVYLFLGHRNIVDGKLVLILRYGGAVTMDISNLTLYHAALLEGNRIYDNGDAGIVFRSG